MQMMKVRIRTKAPMILSAPGHTSVMTATQDSFSGSVLRGIFATRFIKAAALGNAAHENDDFMRLFYGGLRFVSRRASDTDARNPAAALRAAFEGRQFDL